MASKVTVHVSVLEVHINTIEIEIEPEREDECEDDFKDRCRKGARTKIHAQSDAADGEPEFGLEYSHSLGEELWGVDIV